MALKTYKPTPPSQRQLVTVDRQYRVSRPDGVGQGPIELGEGVVIAAVRFVALLLETPQPGFERLRHFAAIVAADPIVPWTGLLGEANSRRGIRPASQARRPP